MVQLIRTGQAGSCGNKNVTATWWSVTALVTSSVAGLRPQTPALNQGDPRPPQPFPAAPTALPLKTSRTLTISGFRCVLVSSLDPCTLWREQSFQAEPPQVSQQQPRTANVALPERTLLCRTWFHRPPPALLIGRALWQQHR